MCGVVALYEGD
jgi:hypothetical protein